MANLYADEQFPLAVVQLLRTWNHDILTVQESWNSGISDPDVLAFAINHERVVLTQNRRDFIRLHNRIPDHAGIIICTEDRNLERLAKRIHEAIAVIEVFTGKLIRVNRPAK
jgi:predicted nuclease of predicted toxin-antitoxin system